MSFIMKNIVSNPDEANIGVIKHKASIKVYQNNFSYQIPKKNTDTDDENDTEVSVFQYIFEIRSNSISI